MSETSMDASSGLYEQVKGVGVVRRGNRVSLTIRTEEGAFHHFEMPFGHALIMAERLLTAANEAHADYVEVPV